MRIGLYCLDQDKSTTTTLGIFNYTRRLIGSLAELPDRGFELILLLSEANKADFSPLNCPSWMQIHSAPGSYGRGWRRIWADQVLAARSARWHNIDLMHFPKGWLPLYLNPEVNTVVTIHDTIVQHYRLNYPNKAPLRFRYFDWIARHSLRRADMILTVSDFSKQMLSNLEPNSSHKIRVVVEGTGLDLPEKPTQSEKEGILVLGSVHPHKATLQTCRLIDAWAKRKNTVEKVTLTGLNRWLRTWGKPPENLEINFGGMVTDNTMIELMTTHKALVLLSEIEGFGLPALEAYRAGTAVCYRNSSALAEMLKNTPGGWDGEGETQFFQAMDEALSMSPALIDEVQDRLKAKYNWRRGAEQTVEVYRKFLNIKINQ